MFCFADCFFVTVDVVGIVVGVGGAAVADVVVMGCELGSLWAK